MGTVPVDEEPVVVVVLDVVVVVLDVVVVLAVVVALVVVVLVCVRVLVCVTGLPLASMVMGGMAIESTCQVLPPSLLYSGVATTPAPLPSVFGKALSTADR